MRFVHLIAAVGAFVPTIADAAETIAYSYDAKGRLTQVAHSGFVNNGVTSNYQFDKADNRTAVDVTGSPFNAPVQPVIAVPIRGISIVTLPNAAQ